MATLKPKILPPHQYPLWIKGLFALLVLSFFYSILLFPQHFIAMKHLHAADTAYANKQLDLALTEYRLVQQIAPQSQSVRVGLAKSLLANTDQTDDIQAMEYLVGLTLSDKEWSELSEVMPLDYQQYFTSQPNE